MQRLIAIDLGDKRTGLALGDTITRIASPAGLIETAITERDGEALLDALDRAVTELVGTSPARLIIGLPINMDGTEGPRAKLVRAFGARLAGRLAAGSAGRPAREIVFHDERRSSMAADERMAQTGLTHKQKKQRRDAIAAAAILQSYLDEHTG